LGIKIGSVSGIPLYLDYSWFLIFALIVYTVGFWLMPVYYPNLSWITYLTLGVLSAFLLFISIVIHELAHSIVAKRSGLKIGRITLYLLGGVSEMEEEPPNANLELKMSAAGPLTSIAITLACSLGWVVSVDVKASILIQGPLLYSFIVNAIVAGFNLIPAFPMDGGRILRSLIWRRNDDMMRSTRIASTVGKFFAYMIAFAGIFFLIFVDIFDGIWLLLIGWMISSGASGELNQMILQRDLANMKAKDVMTRTVDSVTSDMTLFQLSNQFLEHKHNGFPVLGSNGEIIGCVTMDDLRHARKNLWNSTLVKDIMVPRERLITVKAGDPAQNAANLMTKNRIGRIFVLSDDDGDQLSGIITRTDILKTIQIQEGIYGGTKGRDLTSGMERFVSVEKGMLFEIDAPATGWISSYNPNEFALISQNIVQLSAGSQTTQFTFEPLQIGRYSIIIYPSTSSPNSRESIKYTIDVS
jgi:Zn-dependent protease/CBS domain-containing protein